MRTAWRPSPGRLAVPLAVSAREALTYTEVGASGGGRPPEAYALLEDITPVGRGRASWERVAGALLRWDLHREARMVLATTAPTTQLGCTVVNAALFGPVALLAPCRVVAVVDEPARRGFAYGTLPGHPLAGEEQFTVELHDDGRVRLRIRSFSRPTGLLRLLPGAARAGQRLVNRRYAAAARRLAA